MKHFIMLVGLSGSGKSYRAKSLAEKYGAKIIESDAYRSIEYGDESIQGDNVSLFQKIHADIISMLSNGESVVSDATNISRKHRVFLLQKINRVPDVKKDCYIIATQYKYCIVQNKNRTRQVPEYIVKRQRENFNIPIYQEGWDFIDIIYKFNREDYSLQSFIDRTLDFNQDNPNHKLTLGHHCIAVAEYMRDIFKVDSFIEVASLLHDNGKEHTKVFHNMRGEPTDIAHYYNHDSVGAYEAMFYMGDVVTTMKDFLFACSLIEFHMRPYFIKTYKARKKLLNTVGEDLFYFLQLLNKADIESH